MFGWSSPVSLVNGRIMTVGGEAASVRFSTRILSIDEPPKRGDVIVDLEGAVVLPGLINAHDHLELNHYGHLQPRPRYTNAIDWIDDLAPELRHNDEIRARSAWPLRERLFIGGLKNLLAGVTTVGHHNPIYRECGDQIPVRLLRAFRWAHSFALEGRPVGAHGEPGAGVRAACEDTPARVPFIVHAAEGTDDRAAREFARLESLHCLKPNTVLVHGVGLSMDAWRLLLAYGSSIVWCPASNLALFGQTIPARAVLDAYPRAAEHLCLATDSRITGSRDLLDELRAAHAAEPVTAVELLRMVTTTAAAVLRLRHAGRIDVGEPADLFVIPGGAEPAPDRLLASTRADTQLVTVGGRPLVSRLGLESVFKARRQPTRGAVVDGTEKLLNAAVAHDLQRCPIPEPGVRLH